jgi:hypothetical protein
MDEGVGDNAWRRVSDGSPVRVARYEQVGEIEVPF